MPDSSPNPPAGPAVDARGIPSDDPTQNVLALVDAAVKRLDDLRHSESNRLDNARIRETEHIREMMKIRDEATRERQRFNEALRKAETARIDAIRAVDVAAVSRAAEVSSQQALTLAAQVQTSAETLRAQVTAAATATAISLSTALEPILKRVEELSNVQYKQQGERAQAVESKGTGQWIIGLVISLLFLSLSISGFAISIATH